MHVILTTKSKDQSHCVLKISSFKPGSFSGRTPGMRTMIRFGKADVRRSAIQDTDEELLWSRIPSNSVSSRISVVCVSHRLNDAANVVRAYLQTWALAYFGPIADSTTPQRHACSFAVTDRPSSVFWRGSEAVSSSKTDLIPVWL